MCKLHIILLLKLFFTAEFLHVGISPFICTINKQLT